MKNYKFGNDPYYRVEATINGDNITIEIFEPYYYSEYKTTKVNAEDIPETEMEKFVNDYIENNKPSYIKSYDCD